MADFDPTWMSLLPALVTIGLAFATRQVIPSLFFGIVTGSLVLFLDTGLPADLNFVSRFLVPSIGSAKFAEILVIYLWCLGGLIGMWEKTGAARHFAEVVGHNLVQGPRSARVFGWLVGVVFHQGGTVSTVLAGTTVKPVSDEHQISHEELSYIVDSTASPIATLLPFNAWPGYVAGLVTGTIPLLATKEAAVSFFFASLPFNFYALLAVLSTFLLSVDKLPWMGKSMKRAQKRARLGALDSPSASPMIVSDVGSPGFVQGYQPNLIDFLLPLGLLLGIAIAPKFILDQYWIKEAFMSAAISAMILAGLRGMSLVEIMTGFIRGCQSMTIGAIVLALAVTLATVSKDLQTAAYLVQNIGQHVPAWFLPGALTALCMLIAFSTGTSFGTYAVVFPIAMPLAFAINPDPTFLKICFGAVLGGSVFGDQCSPISDTTILSSMFTGCDLMDHVKTQLPLALTAAGIGALLSTLCALIF